MTTATLDQSLPDSPLRIPSAVRVAVTQQIRVPGRIEDVFDFLVAEDVLPKILTGYGLLPGIVSTSQVSGPWDQPGATRTVHLADGSTVREGVTHYQRARYFAYRIWQPSFALKYLMSGAVGQFWSEQQGGEVEVTWTYTFAAKNRIARLPLWLFVQAQWKGYMAVCMANIARHLAAA